MFNKKMDKEERELIQGDIDRIDAALDAETKSSNELKALTTELNTRYIYVIMNWFMNDDGLDIDPDEVNEQQKIKYYVAVLKNFRIQINEYLTTGNNARERVAKIKNQGMNITNNNINTNSNVNNIDIDVFASAIAEIEDACLNEEAENQAKEKIKELEELVKSKEKRKTKWGKAKDIFKWAIEQGIQIAGIILPLVVNL